MRIGIGYIAVLERIEIWKVWLRWRDFGSCISRMHSNEIVGTKIKMNELIIITSLLTLFGVLLSSLFNGMIFRVLYSLMILLLSSVFIDEIITLWDITYLEYMERCDNHYGLGLMMGLMFYISTGISMGLVYLINIETKFFVFKTIDKYLIIIISITIPSLIYFISFTESRIPFWWCGFFRSHNFVGMHTRL